MVRSSASVCEIQISYSASRYLKIWNKKLNAVSSMWSMLGMEISKPLTVQGKPFIRLMTSSKLLALRSISMYK